MTIEQDRRISDTVAREAGRLRSFIRRRVANESDAEDILQEVFYELVEAYRLPQPLENAGAWLFRVARNRIIDLFRRRRPQSPGAAQSLSSEVAAEGFSEADPVRLEDLLPSPYAGPDAAYARGILLEELEAAIEELPREQRDAFVAHEIEGLSFRELAARTGLGENTLRLRKPYATQRLRQRLEAIHAEFSGT